MDASTFLIQTLILCNLYFTSQSINFTFHGFNQTSLKLIGSNVIKPPNGALRLTNNSKNIFGHAFYPTPIPMLKNSSSFTSNFVFQINPSAADGGGYGLAFTLSPLPEFPGAAAGHYMGVFNESNSGNSSNHVFMVEFDTVNGYDEGIDSDGNHVGINVNGVNSTATGVSELRLEKGSPISAWIEYDETKKRVNVTIARLNESKPIKPLISEDLDLSAVVVENMYAGFSAATGEDKSSSHYVLGWNFCLNCFAEELDPDLLPRVEEEEVKKPSSKVKVALIATFCFVFVVSAAWLMRIVIYRSSMKYEELEEWEKDCPHRIRFRDLYKATKGFDESERIGVGRFGVVYKGVLPSTGVEVAVKKIMTNNQLQGMREFAAEIESLGRLRHKNLVHLQGWCKHRNDLLLVYDYVPNGSLDSLLHGPGMTRMADSGHSGAVLSWEERLNVIKGVGSGLLYLHEEWEQVVIHRDVKSSNVLIDKDMRPRLGDFGLARLYDHGKNSHTTNVVGTIGYIAPELTTTGKASTSSDVFAYGILILEIACGRAAVVHQAHRNVILVDWVVECVRKGSLFDAVDERLRGDYVVEEMELVLGLGLLCSNPRPELRPTMRQVMKYLNGDEILPLLERLSLDGSRRVDEITSRFLELGLMVDRVANSYGSYGFSSLGEMSSSSFEGEMRFRATN